MARKLTQKDWGEVDKQSKDNGYRVRYKWLDEEDGESVMTLLTGIYKTEPGEEDIIGNKNKFTWGKNEAKVELNGTQYVLTFGWDGHPFMETFKAACKESNIMPYEVEGTKWSIQKLGDKSFRVEFLERVSDGEVDEDYQEVKDAITQLRGKKQLRIDGVNQDEFIRTVAIIGNIDTDVIEENIPNLVSDKIISLRKGVVKIK